MEYTLLSAAELIDAVVVYLLGVICSVTIPSVFFLCMAQRPISSHSSVGHYIFSDRGGEAESNIASDLCHCSFALNVFLLLLLFPLHLQKR
ncbi:uncharacterized protein EI97DRAFT_222553 [Westerdykella ornata]|uniref:Uncharacterized protein n=1 Tax=Westerdykella ornata TaxID=318751 RepID=A0A6A6JV16_WESOR|nr:uncharacterized protein EI97DRAFT_222553 [Westerdykella ornata]KAF2278879.1 hypothetical protein EI97DRAFT_222553 [Westerdykella ornata]